MLANADMHKELTVVDEVLKKETNPVLKAALKMLQLSVKLLHDIRSNQVTDMKSRGVSLIEPKKKPDTVK
jgi:hypothetical protein